MQPSVFTVIINFAGLQINSESQLTFVMPIATDDKLVDKNYGPHAFVIFSLYAI